MSQPPIEGPRITLEKSPDYRDTYANSVQIRLSVWDLFLVFGTMQQPSNEEITVTNFQGIYLSPQQAKALQNLLTHNIAQYEQTFGPITLDAGGPNVQKFVVPSGPVH
jgi:flagellar protein FlaG